MLGHLIRVLPSRVSVDSSRRSHHLTEDPILELVRLHLVDCIDKSVLPQDWAERSLHDSEVRATLVAAGARSRVVGPSGKKAARLMDKGRAEMIANDDARVFQGLWLFLAAARLKGYDGDFRATVAQAAVKGYIDPDDQDSPLTETTSNIDRSTAIGWMELAMDRLAVIIREVEAPASRAASWGTIPEEAEISTLEDWVLALIQFRDALGRQMIRLGSSNTPPPQARSDVSSNNVAIFGPLFRPTMEPNESFESIGEAFWVEYGREHGRGSGEGVLAITDKAVMFILNRERGGNRVRVLRREIERCWKTRIVMPNMSELHFSGKRGEWSFYCTKRMTREVLNIGI